MYRKCTPQPPFVDVANYTELSPNYLMQTKKKPKAKRKRTYQKPLSLYPMKLDGALTKLLKAKPMPEQEKTR